MTQAELSTAELVRHAAQQVSTLVRDEIKLAQAELAEKGRHAARARECSAPPRFSRLMAPRRSC